MTNARYQISMTLTEEEYRKVLKLKEIVGRGIVKKIFVEGLHKLELFYLNVDKEK